MKFKTICFPVAACVGGVAAALLFVAGCTSPASANRASVSAGPAAAHSPAVAAPGKSGAQLWAETCIHCHNIRSPGSLSDAQWDVALLHMRVRANLTAEEQRKILAFMKTAH